MTAIIYVIFKLRKIWTCRFKKKSNGSFYSFHLFFICFSFLASSSCFGDNNSGFFFSNEMIKWMKKMPILIFNFDMSSWLHTEMYFLYSTVFKWFFLFRGWIGVRSIRWYVVTSYISPLKCKNLTYFDTGLFSLDFSSLLPLTQNGLAKKVGLFSSFFHRLNKSRGLCSVLVKTPFSYLNST